MELHNFFLMLAARFLSEVAVRLGVPALGWARFEALTRDYPLPVYALGGMKPKLVDDVIRRGAHGIALSSGIW